MALILAGDEINQPQELSDAEVNHLRRLIAWLECEYNLSEAGQRGFLAGAAIAASDPALRERAQTAVDEEVAKIARVPAYIRHGIRMLDKAVKDHDRKTKMVDGATHD
jgi:hypothetical protein